MAHAVLGKALSRFEGRAKVTGAARYTADTALDGLLYAVAVTSTIASGRIVELDTTAAAAAPGVRAVLHHGNVTRPHRCPEEVSVGERRPLFEDERVYYAGQIIAVVVAETFEQARWASHLVRTRYAEEPLVLSLEAGERAHGAEEDEEDGDQSRGEPERALRDADVQLDVTYRTPVEVHNAMELHAAVARWDGDRLIVHDSTQWVVGQAEALAHTFGLPKENVTVHSEFIGGGFGAKLFLWPHSTAVALAARELNHPVKLVLDRRSQFTTAGHRPATRQRIRLGATREGRLSAIVHESFSHTSLVHDYLESCVDITRSLYACEHVATRQRRVPVNVGTPTPMRGPGETPGLWALESALDELAVQLRLDPLTLRLRNLPERDPGQNKPWSSHTHRECLETAAKRFGWSRRDPGVGSMRDGAEILGWGLASATWPGHRDECRMRVEVHQDGTLHIACATQDIGTGTYTVLAQVVSEMTGLPFSRIHVQIGRSSLPEGPISGGSMATATLVPSVAEATRKAIAALAKLATQEGGPLEGQREEELTLTADGLKPRNGGRAVRVADLLAPRNLAYVSGEVHTQPDEETEQFSTRSFGAHCVEVRWHPGLARLRVSRVTSVIDAGRIINHHTAANQVYGSIVMGVGMALLEHAVYDERTGGVVTDNLADYLVPVHADTPEMDLMLLDRPDPKIGEFGARGIGEIGLTGVAPAIAAAVYHATGKRIRELPITVEKLME